MEEQTVVVGRRWLSSLRRSEADRGERRVLAHHWPTTGPLRAPPGRWQTIRGSWCRRLVCPGSAAVCEITRDCARLPRAEVVWRATGALFVTTDTQPPNNGPQVCKHKKTTISEFIFHSCVVPLWEELTTSCLQACLCLFTLRRTLSVSCLTYLCTNSSLLVGR